MRRTTGEVRKCPEPKPYSVLQASQQECSVWKQSWTAATQVHTVKMQQEDTVRPVTQYSPS
jgi:hypothetical protein